MAKQVPSALAAPRSITGQSDRLQNAHGRGKPWTQRDAPSTRSPRTMDPALGDGSVLTRRSSRRAYCRSPAARAVTIAPRGAVRCSVRLALLLSSSERHGTPRCFRSRHRPIRAGRTTSCSRRSRSPCYRSNAEAPLSSPALRFRSSADGYGRSRACSTSSTIGGSSPCSTEMRPWSHRSVRDSTRQYKSNLTRTRGLKSDDPDKVVLTHALSFVKARVNAARVPFLRCYEGLDSSSPVRVALVQTLSRSRDLMPQRCQ